MRTLILDINFKNMKFKAYFWYVKRRDESNLVQRKQHGEEIFISHDRGKKKGEWRDGKRIR